MRYVINPTTFMKGSQPRWSKTLHTIESKDVNRYLLSNGKLYRDYELQKITGVERRPAVEIPVDVSQLAPIERKPKPVRRFIRKEGLDLANTRDTRRVRRQHDIGPYLA